MSWITGIPADGLVQYGTTTNYGASTSLIPVMRTNYQAELTSLQRGTEYHYRIVSEGTNGQAAVSDDFTFRTRARIYVSANSTATQELGTIEAPFKTLQAAADAAKDTGDDILVAAGTYAGTDPEAVLHLNGSDWDMSVFGGYAEDFTVRDPDLYMSVIDGEKQRRGIWLNNGATLSVSGVTITRGAHEWGGGVGVRKSMFSAEGGTLTGNSSTNGINEYGGGLYGTLASEVRLQGCVVSKNAAGKGGGACIVSVDSLFDVSGCRFLGNHTQLSGSGMRLMSGASGTIGESIIVSNSSVEASGGGVEVSPFCSVLLSGCTITANRITAPNEPEFDGGGGMRLSGSSSGPVSALIENCIIYGNESLYGNDLRVRNVVDIEVNYSCIGDIYGSLTSSNRLIRTDPLFANPAAGDFHLLYGSPCIDTGEPEYDGNAFDMDGEPRPFGAAIDMGADEFTDSDHIADYWETNRFGDLTTSDGTADDDNDALDDFAEYMNQTDPRNADTDNDLAADGWEVANGYDPLDRDMDGDGMWDGWEVAHTLDAFTNDAALNPDGDPHNNLQKFTADTDPHDSNSVLKIFAIRESWGGTRLDWKGGRDSPQYLEMTTNLLVGAWIPFCAIPPPSPLTNAIVVLGETNQPVFYRIRTQR